MANYIGPPVDIYSLSRETLELSIAAIEVAEKARSSISLDGVMEIGAQKNKRFATELAASALRREIPELKYHDAEQLLRDWESTHQCIALQIVAWQRTETTA